MLNGLSIVVYVLIGYVNCRAFMDQLISQPVIVFNLAHSPAINVHLQSNSAAIFVCQLKSCYIVCKSMQI